MMWYQKSEFALGRTSRARLRVRRFCTGYSGFLVIRDLNLDIVPGLTVILGPNGAGKTTLLRALSGQIPWSGEVLLDGDDFPERSDEIVRVGVALVAEGRQLFHQMTVLENLELGGSLRRPIGPTDWRGFLVTLRSCGRDLANSLEL
jgi:branched-chain amino acid transport system ATP-binding protein